MDPGAADFMCAQVGPHIVVFKTHVDIFDKWDDSIVSRLQALATKHGQSYVARPISEDFLGNQTEHCSSSQNLIQDSDLP